jgi:hypothetical protein
MSIFAVYSARLLSGVDQHGMDMFRNKCDTFALADATSFLLMIFGPKCSWHFPRRAAHMPITLECFPRDLSPIGK